MTRFTLERVTEIVEKIDFYYLLVDGKNQYKAFEELISTEGNYLKEIDQLQIRMQFVAQRKTLPISQLRPLGNKEYELKTKHIRLFYFHHENCGHVIVFAVKKDPKTKRQNQQITKFRNLKKQYLDQI